MKTVTQAFLDAQAAGTIQYFFQVNMYRRYWDSGTSKYIYETQPIDIKPFLLSKSNINWQLDTEGLNKWTVSNIQITLKNDLGEFNEGSGKYFDSTYGRFKTKIEILIGYVLPDETTETVYAFTGIIASDVTNDHANKSITISLSGKEIQLSLADAENVSQTVTGETVGTGALSKEFYTQSQNVMSVQAVYIDGVLQSSGYAISNLYQTRYGGKVTFATAPALSSVITIDYMHGNNQIVAGEQLGTGALNSDFYTNYKGVGFIDAVYIDGEKLTALDYTVNNLNDKDNYAKISFPFGIGIGQVVKVDYRHWYKNIAIETVIGYLLDEAGFPPADRTIGAIDVGSLLKYQIWDTKTDWDAQTSTRNVNTTAKIGSVTVANENFVTDIEENIGVAVAGSYPNQAASIAVLDCANKYECVELPEAASPSWYKFGLFPYNEEISPAGILHISALPSGHIYYSRTLESLKSTKTRLKLELSAATENAYFTFANGLGNVRFKYVSGEWKLYYGDAYGLSVGTGITSLNWGTYHTVEMNSSEMSRNVRIEFDGVQIASFEVASFAWGSVVFGLWNDDASATCQAWVDYVYYDAISKFESILTFDGINLGVDSPIIANLGTILRTWTDPADGSTLTIQSRTSGASDFSSDCDIWRDVSFSGNVGTVSANTVSKRHLQLRAILYAAVATSPILTRLVMPAHMLTDVIDCGANLDVYNSLAMISNLSNGLIKLYSATSANGTDFDVEMDVVAGVIASTKRRYMTLHTSLYLTSDGTALELQKLTLSYKIISLLVAMADFSGMTVQGAIEEYARLMNYELGVDAAGKYFFRAKNADATIDMELSGNNNTIQSIDNDAAGWESIFNKVKVSVGKFVSLITPDTEGAAVPHSITKYGTRALEIDGSSIAIDDDLDLASSLARIYYDRYSTAKRSLRLNCKMIPQLELSDTVNINFKPSWAWFLGDSRAWLGKPDIFLFNANMLPVSNLVASVVGLELDLNEWVLYITVREI
jgi:hypothetical protein